MAKTLTINGHLVRSVTLAGANVKAIGDGVNTLWEQAQTDYFYIENLADSANTVTLPKTGSETEWVSLEYSLDKETWANYDLETGVSVPVGGKLYLRGNNNQLSNSVSGSTTKHSFVSTGNIKAGGKAISLLSKDLSKTTIDYWFAFSCLFQNNTKLINTETTLFDGFDLNHSYTFQYIFDGCTNLQDVCSFSGVTTPKQASFIRAYRNCTGITNASGFLPNATSTLGNRAFFETFSHCTSLTTLPSFANVSIGADVSVFNGTFYGCTAVTTPAAMPQNPVNVAGSHKFYQMYYNCTNLQRSPKMSIATATENMLCGIFYNCSNIDYINIEFSAWDGATDFTKNWVTNVHSTGVFCKNSTLPVTRGVSNIPANWSIADLNGKLYAPVITENGGTITIAEAEGGASCQIYYTTDGTTPTTNSTLYTQPFAVAAGTTVKAIAHYNGQSAAYVAHSDVTEYTTSSVTYYSYIHNQTVGTGDTNHRIDTGILPTTSTVFRFKGKFVGYDQGGVWVGTQGSSDSNDYRFFYANSYYFDWNSGRLSGGKLNNGDIIDVTCSNYRMYDNVNDRVISSGSTQNTVPQYNILVDVGSLWVKSLEIWDNGVLVFDGRAAELNGSVGLYDSVSGTLFTNSNLTIVGETSSLLPPTIAMNQNNIKITTNDFGTTYYTTDGTTPNENSTAYTQEFPAVLNQTIKAVTIDGGVSSTVASYTVTTSQLSSPSISRNQNNVKITQGNQSYKSVSIYYTTDGTTPTSGSTLYTGEFTAVLNQTIKAVCISSLDLYTQSTTTTYTVTASQLTAPTITRVDNNVALAQTNDNYKSVSIYYTTDGTTPSSGSTLYTAPFAAVLGQTVKAVCVSSLDLYTQSTTTTFEVVATQLASPKIAYNNGYVTLTDQNNVAYGAELHYTTDGTTPDATSTLYTAPFAASVGDTIKAIAITTNNLYTNSDVTTKEIETHNLPSNTFLVNYNAKEFDTTTNTFPKTTGQLFDKDLVLNNAPASTNIPNGYVTLNGRSYMNNQFASYTYNIFNRYNNANERTLTLVYKVNWSGTGGGEAALFGNRGTSAQSSYNYHNYMIRYKVIGGLTNLPSLSAGANFGVYYCRVNSDASGIFKCVTNGEYVTGQNITYPSNPSGNVTFFGDSDYGTSTSFHYQGDFYWLYISNEALTDAEIDAVIDYNENL